MCQQQDSFFALTGNARMNHIADLTRMPRDLSQFAKPVLGHILQTIDAFGIIRRRFDTNQMSLYQTEYPPYDLEGTKEYFSCESSIFDMLLSPIVAYGIENKTPAIKPARVCQRQ